MTVHELKPPLPAKRQKVTKAHVEREANRRQQELRARRKAAGLVPITAHITPEAKQFINDYKTAHGCTIAEALEAIIEQAKEQ